MQSDHRNPVAGVTGAVRDNVLRRIEDLTGLEVTEVNVTVAEIYFPEEQQEREALVWIRLRPAAELWGLLGGGSSWSPVRCRSRGSYWRG